jgi:predicted DNA binding CopG/RHH family protein
MKKQGQRVKNNAVTKNQRVTTISLPEGTFRRLKSVAREKGVSVSRYINDLVWKDGKIEPG